jgi:OOP family OmpA-OmpF porin
VTWDLGTLPLGAPQACVQLTVNVTAPNDTVLVNSATITGNIFTEVSLPPTTQTETTLVGVTPEELFQGLGEGKCANLIPVGGPHAAWALAIVPLMLLGIWLVRRPRKHGGRLFLLAGILIGMSSLMMPPRAHAVDLGWYAGAGLGGAWTGVSGSDLDSRLAGLGYTTSSVVDDVDIGWKVFGGYQLHEYFALEAIYVDLGDVSSTISASVPDPVQFVADASTVHPYSVNGAALAGVLTWPVNDNILVFGKFGGFRWNADIRVWCSTCLGTSTADGWDWMGGAGAEYDFANDVGVRLEWEHYATDRDDVELFSGSVLYRFK